MIGSEQGPALGSAIHAAVAAGAYPDIRAAAEAMGTVRNGRRTCPTRRRAEAYDALFAEYPALHDHFGRGGNDVMHRLKAHPPRGRRRTWPRHDASPATSPRPIAALRREVCALHAELTRYELVVWTAGNVSARVPGARPAGDQAHRGRLRRADAGEHGRCDLDGHGRRGRARARRRDTAAHAYVYRHMPDVGGVVHTHSHLRHRLGGARRADPVRAHDDGRRVRRRDPGRAVRPDRRRLDRPRHRRDAARAAARRRC